MIDRFPFLRFLAHFLFILAAWTLVIKFVFPIGFAIAQGKPFTTYIFWDLWWVVHIALGISLLQWKPYSLWFGILTAIAEIIIVVTKFMLFLSAPHWSIWRTNWFINKVFVLTCFTLMLYYLVRNYSELRVRN